MEVEDQGQIQTPEASTVRNLAERIRAVVDEVPGLVAYFRGSELVLELANAMALDISAGPRSVGCPAEEVFENAFESTSMLSYLRAMREVYATGESRHGLASPARLVGRPSDTYWDYSFIPVRAADGTVDGVFLHAVEVTRLVEARTRAGEAEHRFTTLSESNVIGVTITDDERVLEANDAWLEMIGYSRADLAAGLSWTEVSAPESADADRRALESLRRDGVTPPYEKEYVRSDGTRVAVLVSGSVLREDPLQILATVVDLSERKAVEREISSLLDRERDARFAAELAGARMTRLQEITASLSASNSASEIARAVVHHAVEDLSASAGLLARGGQGELEVAYAVGFAPDRVEQWRQFPATMPDAFAQAAETGETVTLDTPDAVRELGAPGALTVLPLIVADRLLGVLALLFRGGRPLAADDVDFLSSLTRQAAAALDRARLYENRAYVARKLQEGLLPSRLPELPNMEAAVVYESISGGGEVGGDFYDVFKAGPQRWAVSIGDVCGKGTDAAVITGLARHTLRAIARVQESPAEVLEFLNGALRRHGTVPAFCTVGYAMIEQHRRGGFKVRIASGGHPYPLVVRVAGNVEEVPVTGTMLGVAEDPDIEEVTMHLRRGDALALYTDGIVDARRRGGERFGEEQLVAALASAAGGSAEELAAAVEAAVRAHHPGAPADDRAIVVLRAT